MGKKTAEEKTIKVEDYEKIQKELESLKDLAVSLEAQLKRAVADYRNLEQRINAGRSELTSFVGAELIKKILPALDHLEQALLGASDVDKQSGWFKGVEMAAKELNQVLVSEGLDKIPVEGVFDPNLHEAVDTREGEDNIILEVVRKGYRLNGKILRPAQVVVGRKSEDNPERPEGVEGSN